MYSFRPHLHLHVRVHQHSHTPIHTHIHSRPPTHTHPYLPFIHVPTHPHLSTPTPIHTSHAHTHTHTHTEPYRRSSTTHYDEEHGEGDTELDTSTQETTGGWMEVQPTNQKATAPQVSVKQSKNIVIKLEAHNVSYPEHVEMLVFVTEGRHMFKV